MINIYQVLPRLFGNENTNNLAHGNIKENGCGKLNDFSLKALHSIKKMGITHIWYTGVIEHATQTDYSSFAIRADHQGVVKGQAGSPYAIKDYYDIDPDLAEDVTNRMVEFEALVERTHKAGLQVIIDFVPNHVAREYRSDAKPRRVKNFGADDNQEMGFSPQNNFYYIPEQSFYPQFDAQGYTERPAKVTGNDCFSASPSINDWYETVKLNYGVDYLGGGAKHFDPLPDTWNKMKDILLFWAKKGVDAFRCDMAEMVPVEFWAWVIPQVKKKFPQILFIAEVYNPTEYRNYIFNGKFDYLYDKVGLYDTLRATTCHQSSAANITHAWQAVSDIQPYMLNFLENHDEQRIASDFFAGNAEKAFPAVVVSALLSNSPFMLYFGQELGERGMDAEGFSGLDGRTTIFDYWSMDSFRNYYNGGKMSGEKLSEEQLSIQSFYQKILTLRLKEKALSQGLFYDLMWLNYENPDFNSERQYAFLRYHEGDLILAVVNFDDSPANVKVNIGEHAFSYLNLALSKKMKCTNLLSGEKWIQTFSSSEPIALSLPSRGVLLLKMK